MKPPRRNHIGLSQRTIPVQLAYASSAHHFITRPRSLSVPLTCCRSCPTDSTQTTVNASTLTVMAYLPYECPGSKLKFITIATKFVVRRRRRDGAPNGNLHARVHACALYQCVEEQFKDYGATLMIFSPMWMSLAVNKYNIIGLQSAAFFTELFQISM